MDIATAVFLPFAKKWLKSICSDIRIPSTSIVQERVDDDKVDTVYPDPPRSNTVFVIPGGGERPRDYTYQFSINHRIGDYECTLSCRCVRNKLDSLVKICIPGIKYKNKTYDIVTYQNFKMQADDEYNWDDWVLIQTVETYMKAMASEHSMTMEQIADVLYRV